MATLRTFIAAPLSGGPALRKVISALGGMGRALKPVNADQLHLTLKFLGDTPAEQVPGIGAAVREAVSAAEAFELTIRGLGVFPHARRPTVVWAGIESAGPLIALAGELEARLEDLGYARENRPYQPHLTLARIRSRPPDDLGQLLDREAATDFGAATVESIVYYQSELQSGGPVYTPLETVTLS